MTLCGFACSFRCTEVVARCLLAAAPSSAPEFDSGSLPQMMVTPAVDITVMRVFGPLGSGDRCVDMMTLSEGK